MPPPRLDPRQDVCRTTHVATPTMRPPCWQNGITVSTKDGKEIGESKAAAFGAVAQVSPPPPLFPLHLPPRPRVVGWSVACRRRSALPAACWIRYGCDAPEP